MISESFDEASGKLIIVTDEARSVDELRTKLGGVQGDASLTPDDWEILQAFVAIGRLDTAELQALYHGKLVKITGKTYSELNYRTRHDATNGIRVMRKS